MIVLLDAGSRAWRVRAVQALLMAPGLAMVVLAFRAVSAMRSEAGELASLSARLGVGAGLLMLGLTFVASAFFCGLRYVRRLERQGDELAIWTLSPFPPHRFTVPVADVSVGARLSPPVRRGGTTIEAPWRNMRVRGYRFPFILDLQAPVLNRNLSRLGAEE